MVVFHFIKEKGQNIKVHFSILTINVFIIIIISLKLKPECRENDKEPM